MEETINLTREAINELLTKTLHPPAVTIYLPTHRAPTPPNMTEDQIRCRNLVRQAVDMLYKRPDGRVVREQLETWLESINMDRDFWDNQTEGLLICLQANLLRLYRLAIDTEEYVAVDDSFHLAPIFGILNDQSDYYVLTVTQHEPVLLRGNDFELKPSGIRLPATLAAALNLDEGRKGEQQRSAGADASRRGSYNGRGGVHDPGLDDRNHFWRRIDEIMGIKADKKLPLILAGTDSEITEYRALARYPKIVSDWINASSPNDRHHDLFVCARAIARAYTSTPDQAVLDEYERAKGQAPDQALQEPNAILDAAKHGRIDKLIVAAIRRTADNVHDSEEPVPVVSFSRGSMDQLMQDSAQLVWRSGGMIRAIATDAMPEPGALLLATLRY